jgi:D-3-phosphoglycerate dehydrogenase
MNRIVVPDDFPRAFSGTKAEERLRSLGEVQIYGDKAKTQDELIERIKGFDAVVNIRAYTRLDREVFVACPKLRLVSVWGAGTDNVDLNAAQELGVTIANTPGANAAAVAEHTIALLLALARQIPSLDREVRSGKWPKGELVQLNGKVMGLIGFGAIGKRVAKIAKGMGMEVLAWTFNPSPQRTEESGARFVSMQDLLRSSDVNTARAGLIAPGELVHALRSKTIAGAALDVFDQEPLPPGDPITELPNVVLTPHNAGTTPEANVNGLTMAVDNVEAFLTGKKIDPSCLVVQGNRR